MVYTNSTGLMDETGHITADLYELLKTCEVLGVFHNLIAYWPGVEPHPKVFGKICFGNYTSQHKSF